MSKLEPAAAPHTYEVLDRAQLVLPSWYLPLSEGAVIAGESILRAAGYRPGSNRPRGWTKINRHTYQRRSGHEGRTLKVSQCGDFWVIERLEAGDCIPRFVTYALVCAFSRRPIWARTCQAAMRLADHYDPIPQQPVAGCWIEVPGR